MHEAQTSNPSKATLATEIVTSVLGTALIGFAVYNAYVQIESGEAWDLWSVAAMAIPLVIGVILGWPRSARMTVEIAAPVIPWIDHEGEPPA